MMIRNFAVFLAFLLSASGSHFVTAQHASILETQLSEFDSTVFLLAEPAVEQTLTLNANNGFFTKGAFKAFGEQPASEGDKQLIRSHFDHLSTVGTKGGSARWYFWVTQPGHVNVEVTMRVPQDAAKTSWTISIDDQSQVVKSQPGDESKPQDWKLRFRLEKKGKHIFRIERSDNTEAIDIQLHQIVLTGSAIENSSLLRARWRPKAIHSQYQSSTCKNTLMWVFESQSIANHDSYSPITTPFGYFGGSFTATQTTNGNVNFSMWAASRKQETMPPLNLMPHLLATGNPQAEFSGFGHEGSGVKIRNWTPLSHQPKSLIQALRMETGPEYNTFYGYLFDDQQNRWVLYAVGRKAVESKKRRRSAKSNSLRAASFCEVPGPPQTQRTGDMRRVIRRRGWFMDDQQNWHPVDRQTSSTKNGPANQFIDAKDGWFLMGTGGMEFFEGKGEVRLDQAPVELPDYLTPEKTKQLFELPVVIDNHKITSATKNSATIAYEFSKVGAKGQATLHYGPKDCITFVDRQLHGTEKKGLSAELLSSDRTWASATEPTPVRDNKVEFHLEDLDPDTKYHFRVLVTSETGKSWEFQSGSLTTKPK